MPTFKINFQRVYDYAGYIEATDAQNAVDKVAHPVDRDADGTITATRVAGDASDWDAVNISRKDKVLSLAEVGSSTTITEIPEPKEQE